MRSAYGLAALTLLLSLPGCYRYRPVTDAPAGAEVRVRLSTAAAVQRSEVREEPMLHVNGRVVESTPEVLSVDVLVARDPSQFRNVEIRDTMRLRRDEVQSMMLRELAPLRSAAFTVGLAAGAFAIVQGISALVGGTTDDNGTPPPQASLMPGFSIGYGAGGLRIRCLPQQPRTPAQR